MLLEEGAPSLVAANRSNLQALDVFEKVHSLACCAARFQECHENAQYVLQVLQCTPYDKSCGSLNNWA